MSDCSLCMDEDDDMICPKCVASICDNHNKEVTNLQKRVANLRETLEINAKQKTFDDMTGQEYADADFVGAYEIFIESAKEALEADTLAEKEQENG